MTHKSIEQQTPGRGPLSPQNLKSDHEALPTTGEGHDWGTLGPELGKNVFRSSSHNILFRGIHKFVSFKT